MLARGARGEQQHFHRFHVLQGTAMCWTAANADARPVGDRPWQRELRPQERLVREAQGRLRASLLRLRARHGPARGREETQAWLLDRSQTATQDQGHPSQWWLETHVWSIKLLFYLT